MNKLKALLIFGLSITAFHSTSLAVSNVTIECKEFAQGEGTQNTMVHKISFDADKGYKTLSFPVYGSTLKVTASFYMSQDGKTCGHSVDQICVSLPGSSFCTNKAEATLFPTDRYAQPGDSTHVVCSLPGQREMPCPTEE